MLHKLQVLGAGRIFRTAASVNRHGLTLLALLHSVKNTKGFVEDENRRLNYGELYRQSLLLAGHLHQNFGVSQKSRVAIAGGNSTGFVRALFAASGLGADVFLLSPGQKQDYYTHLLASHKIDILLGGETLAHLSLTIPFCNYEAEIVASASAKNAVTLKKSNIVILSSGSTGVPKAGKRKVSALKFLNPLVAIINKLGLKQHKSVLISVPLFHGYGLAALMLSVFMGKGVYLAKKFDAAKTLSFLHHKNPDCWITVPLMVQKALAISPDIPPCTVICGGDVLPPSVVQALHGGTGVTVFNLYGTSEAGVCTIATNADLRRYPDTIGKPITGIKMKVENGTLLVKCAWSAENNGTGYIATGDRVSTNPEGFYFYKGRTDDMLVIGGENVYPIEIENAVYKHPAIKWVKAGGTSKSHSTKVHLDIVLHKGGVFNEEDFRSWLAAEVPGYVVPKTITVLPAAPDGKLL